VIDFVLLESLHRLQDASLVYQDDSRRWRATGKGAPDAT
jgi:hypothetical protein